MLLVQLPWCLKEFYAKDVPLASDKEPPWNLTRIDRSFGSPDARFGLRIRRDVLTKILEHCVWAKGLETGGILVGTYNEAHDVAFISDASGPPRDSKSGATWFYRGVQGLQAWLRRLWAGNCYYLGEWHFHPGARPKPSKTDVNQIREISNSTAYNCPEPLLVIVGGEAPGDLEVRAFVSPRDCALIALKESGATEERS